MSVCDGCLRYSERKGDTPYRHLWPVQIYHFFPHYLMNGTNLLNTTVTEQDMIKNIIGIQVQYPLFLPDVNGTSTFR